MPFEKKKDLKYYFHVSLPKQSVQRPLTLGVISKQYSAVTKPFLMMLSLMLFFNAQRYHMCQFLSVCGLTIQEFYPNIVFLFDVRHLYVVCGLSIIRRNQKISSLSFLKHSACFVSIYVFLELSLCKIVISSFFGLARHSIWGSEEAATSGKLSRKENR